MAKLSIEKIRLRSGLEFVPGKLTVIVGPNNAGKTQLLRDLVRCTTQAETGVAAPVVVEKVWFSWPDSLDDLKELMKGALKEQPDGNTFVKTLGPTLVQAHQDINLGLAANWEPEAIQLLEGARTGNSDSLNRWFGGHFVSFLRTDDRLQLVNKSTTAHGPDDRPNLLVALYYDRSAEERLNEFFFKAFGQRIRLDTSQLGQIALRVGKDFDDVPPDPRDGVSQMKCRVQLDLQGDGMRGFVGTALGLLVGTRPIVLIDEPEAFLHPPQAVQMGEMIAELAAADADRQVIVATNNADVLRGMLNRGGDFDIIRVSRAGTVVRTTKVVAKEVQTLAMDPVLATARVIEGLFYQAAVVVEADGDSAFYHRIARQICPQDDVLYTRAHNKQTLYKLLRPYRQLGVSAAAIADIDLLRRADEFKPLLEAATDDPLDEPLQLQEQLRHIVEKKPVLAQLNELQIALAGMLQGWVVPTEREAPAALSRVQRELKVLREASSHWDQAKKLGQEGLEAEAKAIFTKVSSWCALRGVFLVPVGQLEGWLTSHGVEATGNKGKWIVQALTKLSELEAVSSKEQQQPWTFIRQVHDYLLRPPASVDHVSGSISEAASSGASLVPSHASDGAAAS